MPMTCSEFLERYSDYDDSLVGSDELARFRAHMAGCPSCARYDRVLRKGRMLARQLPAPEPAAGFTGRLYRRLIRARSGPSLSPLASAAMAAATVLLVVTSGLALVEPTGRDGDVASSRLAAASSAASGPRLVDGRAGAEPVPVGVPVAMEGVPRVLPAVSSEPPREWAAERVDRRLAASYSPLVTGPPAYRAARTDLPGSTSATRRASD